MHQDCYHPMNGQRPQRNNLQWLYLSLILIYHSDMAYIALIDYKEWDSGWNTSQAGALGHIALLLILGTRGYIS